MSYHQLKLAFRTLQKNKTSSLINLAGFILGLTGCLIIYSITSFELSFDTFHPDTERIYRVVGTSQFTKNEAPHPLGFGPRAMPKAIREEISGLETVASFHNIDMPVTVAPGTAAQKRFEGRRFGLDKAQIVAADPTYFDIFRYEWLAGNPQVSLNAPGQVVLTEKKAQLYFGNLPVQEVLGQSLLYGDDVTCIVTGIVKDWSGNTDFTFTDFISSSTIPASSLKNQINLNEWNDIWSASQLFVKLAPATRHEQVEAQFSAFSRAHFGPEHGTGEFMFVPALQPLSDQHFNEDYQDNYTRHAHLPTLYGLLGVAVFIILIASFNFINLSTAQSAQRSHEIGMRKVLGSSRKSLIGQFLGETLLLTLCAAGFALLLAGPAMNSLRDYLPDEVPFSPFRGDILAFMAGTVLLTTLLAGWYPAWLLSAFKPARVLKGAHATTSQDRGLVRKSLIVFQFAFSLVFIIGTIVIRQQLDYIRHKDLGFDTDAVVLLDTQNDDRSRVLAQKLRALSDVEDVTLQWFAPMGENYMLTRMTYKGGSANIDLDVSAKSGDDHYIPLYGLRLVAGRNYLPGDTLKELVVNQSFTKALGFKQPEDAVGKRLEFDGKDYPIAGVVADFHEQSLHAAIQPAFIAHLSGMSKNLGVKLKTRGKQPTDIQATLDAIGVAWKEVFPDKKFDFTFLDDSIAKVYVRERKTASIVQGATAIAVLISCMGLFGLITFMAGQRSKEIGIRKVLGASVASVVGLLSADFLKLIVLALVIASPISWFLMQRWLTDFAYRIDLQWWMFALAGLLACGIALLTIGYQSVRAATANPSQVLKSE